MKNLIKIIYEEISENTKTESNSKNPFLTEDDIIRIAVRKAEESETDSNNPSRFKKQIEEFALQNHMR